MDANDYGKSGVYRQEVKLEQGNEAKQQNGRTLQEEPKSPTCWRNVKDYFQDFCDRTTICGFKHLAEKGRAITEKLWWLIIMIVALYLCATQIYQTYQKWINSPVIVSFATSQTPIWKVPFPAVTICPELKAIKSRFNYTDLYLKKENGGKLNATELKQFEYMSLVCSTPSKLLNSSLATTDQNAIEFLEQVAPDFRKFVYQVVWRGKEYKGDEIYDLFSPILTSEGICYTFNIIDRTEIYSDLIKFPKNYFSTSGKASKWSLESGYAKDADIDSYPRRTVMAGTKGGLKLVFQVNKDDLDYVCGDSLQGFKVTLHHPAQIPRVKQKYIRVPLDQSVVASIKPNMMTTSTDLKHYIPKDRKCYFTTERHLELFRFYNQENCLVECLTNFTLETCGCVGFHMARTNTTPICGAIKGKCMEDVKAIFLTNEVKDAIKHSGKTQRSFDRKMNNTKVQHQHQTCNCLPSCNSLDFDVETSQTHWDWKSYFEIFGKTKNSGKINRTDLNNSHLARIVLCFKDMQFITSERNELYGQTEFWANCGGLLGLYCGFSFISLFEIIYYLSLRVIFNVKNFGRKYWSGSEQLLESRNKNK